MSQLFVIDDDEQLARSIARIVQREGHDCRVVEDLVDATENLDGFAPDLVIVEIQPEWIAGLAAFRAALDRACGRPVPPIFTVGRRELFRTIGAMAIPGDDWTGNRSTPRNSRQFHR